MVHWMLILVGFAFGFFLGACVVYWLMYTKRNGAKAIEKFSKEMCEDVGSVHDTELYNR